MAKRIIKPNVVSGGVAIPLGNNFYYMKGRKHKNGGIDIGSNPKTGIEVEDGEVMQMMQNGAKVFSSMPFLRGSSPANKVLAGENPDNVFRQQELYKDKNNINDDGTKKKATGGQIPPYNTNNKSNMYSRMKDPNRKTIKDWKTGKVATHKLSYATVDDKTVVYPNIQEINGELYDFTDPKNNRGKWDSLRRAIDTGDTLQFNNEADADKFVNNYKKKFKGFDKYAGGGIAYRNAARTVFGDNYPYGIYPLSLDYMFPGDEVIGNKIRYTNQLIPTMSYINKNGYVGYYPAINGFTKENAHEFDRRDSIDYLLNNNRMAQNLYRRRLDDAGVKPNIPDKINSYEDITNSYYSGVPFVNKNAIKYNNDFIGPTMPNSTKLIQYLSPEEAKSIRYTINKDTNPTSSNKFINFFKNKDNLSDTIGIGSNILGSTLSYFANKRMLNNMKAPIKPTIAAPASYQATKLKTNVNINPQLDTLRNSSAIYNNSVDNNTSSSRVALARKQANRLNINNQINALYGNKENQETELINRDRLQQQQTANQNIAQYNDYLTRKAAINNEYNNQLINFNNTINEKKGENLVSLFNNSNAAIQDILNRREQRNNERNTIAAYLASNPNVNPRLFTRLGVDGVFTDEMLKLWDEWYKKNKTKTN